MIKRNPRFGWLPDKLDSRDIPYFAIRKFSLAPIALPESVDLRKDWPPVYDQGNLGSCTAQAVVAAYEVELRKQPALADVSLSKLFVYYNTRLMEGTVESDSGAYIRDTVKVIKFLGTCLETIWPYSVNDFKVKPPEDAYVEALNHQAIVYASVPGNIRDICIALADGYPVVFGFTVYESFENPEVAKTGMMTLPKAGERAVGGHAVLAVGYNQATQHFLVRNSWSSNWGIEGYFWMPFAYVERLARDFWVIQSVE